MAQKSLSNLEQAVMEIIWSNEKCSVRDVLQYLPKNKKYAYTTMATILNRLYKKGLVARKLGKGNLIFSPKITRESYTKNVAQTFLNRFVNSFGDAAVSSFAESVDQLPKEKRKYFIRLLKKNE